MGKKRKDKLTRIQQKVLASFSREDRTLFNYRVAPIFRPLLFLIAGIFSASFLNYGILLPSLLSAATILVAIFLEYFDFHRDGIEVSVISLLACILLGISVAEINKTSNDPYHYSHFVKDEGEETVLYCMIVDDIIEKGAKKSIVEVVQVGDSGTRGKLLLYFDKDIEEEYFLGDILKVRGRVNAPSAPNNPYAFDYQAYLYNRGIVLQTFARSKQCSLAGTGDIPWVSKKAREVRDWAMHRLAFGLDSRNKQAVGLAMVLGYRYHIDQDLYDTFSETGSVHVLAVSGLHVGIVVMIFLQLFKMLKLKGRLFKLLEIVILLGVVWFYAFLTWNSPAVTRAAVMFSIILIGRHVYGEVSLYNIIYLSAFLMLLYQPNYLYQASFQFSYLALLSIIYFHPKIYGWFEFENRFLDGAWNLGAVSIAAQVLVFPVTIYYFHKFPAYFFLSGIISVFLATFILVLGLLVIAFFDVPVVIDALLFAYNLLLEVFIESIYFIRSLPFSNLENIYISALSMVMIYVFLAGFIHALNTLRFRRKWSFAVMLFAVAVLMWNNIYFVYRTSQVSELVFYDVRKATLVDLIHSNKCYSLSSDMLTETNENFAAKNYREYQGVFEKYSAKHSGMVDDKGIMVFDEKVIYFPMFKRDSTIAIAKSHLVLITGEFTESPYRFIEQHQTEVVVLDGSVGWYKRRTWRKLCEERNIPVHDIRADGVYVIQAS